MFTLPAYTPPDFSEEKFENAPDAKTAPVETDGVAPVNFHATSMYPEYYRLGGKWRLAEDSRMDCVVVVKDDGSLAVTEPRRLRTGENVIVGRTEDGSEGIYLYENGFFKADGARDAFAFRQGRSRETAFSRDYDRFYDLLRHEKEHGNILWVLGPALVFDSDSRHAMQSLIENGYADGLMAGNAMATHDLEAGLMHTALGQDIYTHESVPMGHYHHLETINRVRRCGSIKKFVDEYSIGDGVMQACVRHDVPFVLAGSIRDDGPLPEVIHSVYDSQDTMRALVRRATTVVCLATQLHTIATGNMTPSFRVMEDGTIRPVYLYVVDVAEFAVNKLRDRGSLSSTGIVANVQDFIVNAAKGVGVYQK